MEQEVRKHYNQMTTVEKSLLNSFLTSDKKYRMGRHASERMKEKNIKQESIYSAIHNGSIVEYHFKNTNRLLIRGNANECGSNTCLVIDIDRGHIVTVYKNSAKDNHCTLKEELYEKDFNIVSMFRVS